MQIVQDAAFFLASGADQCGELRLQEEFLSGLGVHHHGEGDGVFRELAGFFCAGTRAR